MRIASTKNPQSIPGNVLLVLTLGLAIRIYACQNTFVVNPDGISYIYQAKAIYYGHWKLVDHCGTYFLTSYPIFIAGVYPFLCDWVMAGRVVSCFFGFGALIPLYFLLRSFFDERTSLLTLLILNLTPIFVEGSADLIRDPLFWFFLVLGLLLFVKQMERDRPLYLVLSCLSLLLASWARMEGIPIIILSALYLLLAKPGKRLEKLFYFLLPLVLGGLIFICGAFFLGLDPARFFRVREIVIRLSEPLGQYKHIQAVLSHLLTQYPEGFMNGFLEETRNGIWIVAVGTLLNRICEGFFYPFLFVTLMGLPGIGEEIKKDRRILYFLLLAASLLVLQYFQILYKWILVRRYMTTVILCCFTLTGFGAKRIMGFLQQRFGLRESAAFALGVFLILASGLPRDLMPRERDKLVFKEIGLFISEREGAGHEVGVATSHLSPGWVSFYANSFYEGLHCGKHYQYGPEEIRRGTRDLFRRLKQHGTKYLLWEEKYWPKEAFDLADIPEDIRLDELGRWHHRTTGQMVLYELKSVP